MTTQLEPLFTPIQIGPFELRNRLICTGHNPHYDSGGLIGDQQIAFHVRKAQGGIAMSVTGATSVHPSTGVPPIAPLVNFDDSVLPGYRRLADEMHMAGARMLVQLSHAASAIPSGHSGHATWAPSQTFGEFARELPHVMTKAEIEIILDAFYHAAKRVCASGLDGVELNAFAGGLVQQFLSPVTNQRVDEYGGSFDKRLRFLKQLIRTCREGLGDRLLLTIKLAGDELYDAGLRLADMQAIVRELDALALIDLYVVASGNNLFRFPRVDHWPPTPAPHGLRAELAKGIKQVTTRPVAALCRIVDPRMANELIATGMCDVVAMVRATIADPDIAHKGASSTFADIRPCVGANVCVDRIIDGGEMRCIHNAMIGREREWGKMDRAGVSKKIVIVGGGPAGLEAARVAAERGHRVAVFERSTSLGGNALVVARKPGRAEFIGIVNWLAHQVSARGVSIHLNTDATMERIAIEQPDAIIMATGARDTPPLVDSSRAAIPIVSAWQILSGAVEPGRNVVVIDHMGRDVGCAVAEIVADRGGTAEVVSRHFHPAVDFGLTNTISLYRRLFTKGVTLTAHHDFDRNEGQDILLKNFYSGASRVIRDVDMLVVVTAPCPNDELVAPLRESGIQVHVIGDCVAPRDIETAIFEGHRAARSI